MSSIMKKTELSPVEALLVERTLGDEARRDAQSGTLARIQRLTAERAKLYSDSAAHPLLGPANGPRIRELSAEIDRLWILLRRERANRRVDLERALHVEPEEDEGNSDGGPIRTASSPDAA